MLAQLLASRVAHERRNEIANRSSVEFVMCLGDDAAHRGRGKFWMSFDEFVGKLLNGAEFVFWAHTASLYCASLGGQAFGADSVAPDDESKALQRAVAKKRLQKIYCKETLAKKPLQRYLCTMTDNAETHDETATGRRTGDMQPRVVDMESLKALAHPLRVKILDTLSTYGEFTASGLAERLGESSGATSYHLRQLEKHRFVREVEGKGTGRERWWERVPGGIRIDGPKAEATPTERAASRLVLREWMNNRSVVLNDFLDNGDAVLTPEWLEATMISMSNLHLTLEQTKELSQRLESVLDEFVDAYRGQRVPGSRAIQAHLNVFPVLDADQIPEEETQ